MTQWTEAKAYGGDPEQRVMTFAVTDEPVGVPQRDGTTMQYRLTGEMLLPWHDADLLAAYQRTDGEPGNPEADALLAEIERRGLDV